MTDTDSAQRYNYNRVYQVSITDFRQIMMDVSNGTADAGVDLALDFLIFFWPNNLRLLILWPFGVLSLTCLV